MREDEIVARAKMAAEPWFFLEEVRFKGLPADQQRIACEDKYRKLLAIMAVAMEMPIYTSKYAPETIMLSWFFGFPAFGREQEPGRLRRIPFGKDVKRLFGQGVLFGNIEESNNGFFPGDEAFEAMKEEIRKHVQKVLGS